jgi:hypothetical protein
MFGLLGLDSRSEELRDRIGGKVLERSGGAATEDMLASGLLQSEGFGHLLKNEVSFLDGFALLLLIWSALARCWSQLYLLPVPIFTLTPHDSHSHVLDVLN